MQFSWLFVEREGVRITAEVDLIRGALIDEDVRHHAHILVIVIVDRVAFLGQDRCLVLLSLVLHHIQSRVLWVL